MTKLLVEIKNYLQSLCDTSDKLAANGMPRKPLAQKQYNDGKKFIKKIDQQLAKEKSHV